jgi:CubicO group peptidase (beta-lactamase class C family)
MRMLALLGLLTAALATFRPTSGAAQTRPYTSYQQFGDSLVAQFNRGDFAAIEASSSPVLRKVETPGTMSKYLAGLRAKAGRIRQARPLSERGPRHVFEWQGEQQNLRVTLVSPAPGVLDDYFISDFLPQPGGRPGPAPTDNRRQTRLDQAVDRAATIYMQHPEAVGLSIAVWWQGQPYFYNYGETEKGRGQLPTARTYYDPGSVAKTVVGTLLAQAVLDKKVQLTDDIRRYLPGQYPNLELDGQPIRLVDLANHTSGLPGASHIYTRVLQDSLNRMTLAQKTARYNRYSADSLLYDLHQLKLNTKPGTTYRYNGTAMRLLQLLLERIYQQPYEQLFTRYLSTHFGMRDTRRELSAAEHRRLAMGYDSKSQAQPHPNYTGYWGGPGMCTTPTDLLKYAQASLRGQDPALRLAQQRTWGPAPGPGMGLGWMLDTDPEGQARVYHNGNTPGYNTRLVTYPGLNLAFVVLVNENISQTRLTELTDMLQQDLLPPAP